METTILKDGYRYAVIYTKDRLPVKNDFYQTSEGTLSFDSKRSLWFKGGTHQDHLMAIAYVEYWLEEQTSLPNGLPDDEAIEDESGNWCLDSKEPFIGGAKWMRSLAQVEIETLTQALQQIYQMSDPGDYGKAVIEMKTIARKALEKYRESCSR